MIRQIMSVEIEPYEHQMKKSNLTLAKVDYLYGKFLNGSLVGWAGVKANKSKYIYKTAYVLPPHRGKGVFTELLRHLLKLYGNLPIEAVCTQMSYKIFKEHGFVDNKTYKNKCKKVIKA